jgi:hypothetical protein
MAPRIVTLDIETAPIEAWTWGLWEQNISLDMVKEDWTILSFSAKWLDDPKVIYVDTGGRGKAKVRDDMRLLERLWEVLDSADIVVCQNGKEFDLKKINARFIESGFPPYSPVRVVDTMLAAKKHFGFTSNKLAYLSGKLTKTKKLKHKKYPGFELWEACLRDEKAAWKEMRLYNQVDVLATEELYLKLRPWIEGHPNVAVYMTGAERRCPKCGSTSVKKRGLLYTQTGAFQRFECNACHGTSRGRENLLGKQARKALLGN